MDNYLKKSNSCPTCSYYIYIYKCMNIFRYTYTYLNINKLYLYRNCNNIILKNLLIDFRINLLDTWLKFIS